MNYKVKKVKLDASKMQGYMHFDLNTDYMYRTYCRGGVKKSGKTKELISLTNLAMTAMYNVAAGVWKLMREPDNQHYKMKTNFDRKPIDSFRMNYLHIQPAFILPLARILDTLEDAIKAEDKENALKLCRGAMGLINEEITTPHPKIQPLLDKRPDFTQYFTKIKGDNLGRARFRLKQHITPDQVREVFGDRLLFEDIEE